MGCGASAARVPSVTASLDQGNRRDKSHPKNVVLQEGVASPAQRNSDAQPLELVASGAGAEKPEPAGSQSSGQQLGLGGAAEDGPNAQILQDLIPGQDLDSLPVEKSQTRCTCRAPAQADAGDTREDAQENREPTTSANFGAEAEAEDKSDQDTEPKSEQEPPEPGKGTGAGGETTVTEQPTATTTTITTITTTDVDYNCNNGGDSDRELAVPANSQQTLFRPPSSSPSSSPSTCSSPPAVTMAPSQPTAVQPASSPPSPPPPAPATPPMAPAKQLEQKVQKLPPQQTRMVNCAVSLQFLIDFCRTVPEDMPTWKVVTDVIVPATQQRQCRYVEMIEARHVGPCDYFISHRWATPFSHLVRYVRKHLVELGDVVEEGGAGIGGRSSAAAAVAAPAGVVLTKAESTKKWKSSTADDDEEAGPTRSADKVFVWCDIFAINQHPGQVQADDLAQLKDCVEASNQTLLCLDDKGLVLTRIWCLYEIWNTILAGGPPKLAVLGYDVNQDAFKEVYITLDVSEAQATVDSDRVRILADIAASTGLQELNLVIKQSLVESTQAEAENALKVMLPKAKEWKDYERVIQALNKHMQMLVALGRHQESRRYGYILQTVNTAWQKAQAGKPAATATGDSPASSPGAPSAGAGAATAVGDSARAVAGGAAANVGEGNLPEWHWSKYPRDAALRQVVNKAASAERHGRFETAMSMYRDAVSKAQQRLQSPRGGGPLAPLALDLAGCQLHLAVCLAAQGFPDQAVSEAGEAAVQAFKQHSGPRSLPFASAAHHVAVLSKNNWESKDLRALLLDAAYGIREAQLGPTHEATLETLREKADATVMGGDMAAGVQLYHKLAVRMSEGTDLAAKPPSSTSAAAAADAAAAILEISAKACEVWFLLATYISGMEGRSDEAIRICKALIPHKRRQHVRQLRDVVTDPNHKYFKDAVSELRRLGFSRAVVSSRPSSTASSVASSTSRRGVSGAIDVIDLEPDGLADPDDPRVDVLTHSSELNLWSTVLAKKGKLRDAVLLQWRMAEAFRNNEEMAKTETQLPTGKFTLLEAYERCLILDLSAPGVAKLAAEMLAERDGGPAGGAVTPLPTTLAPAAAPAAAAAPVYSGPSYMELIQQMTAKWSALDFKAAESICRQIVECQAAGHGPVSKEVVDARQQLAQLLNSAGRIEEALKEMRETLALHEKLLHGKDPTMNRTLQALADMVSESDRAEGEKLHRRAVDLLTKVYGPDHFEVGAAMMQLASFIMSDCERMEEGQELLQRGLAIHQKFQEQQAAMTKAF
ncbi:hypothetical protein VaNZ11_016119 [Volvox africanus]|uniref:Uncharacterized protein n=1 Tax=Volvox africanus TaxID=51714 RepID=A0ABQ5SNE8_9CHLO|nr:hypothetical protein VaNZ11_016119 [Volvox africanus]